MTGAQIPRYRIEPERVTTDGADAAALMAAYGNALDEWQQLVLDCWLGRDASGRYRDLCRAGRAPGRTGKTCAWRGESFSEWSSTARRSCTPPIRCARQKKSFNRLVRMFTDKRHPEVLELVKNIRYTNGEECIELLNGGSIEFSARSRQAARGFDGISLVVYDEAQELTDDQVEAIMATLAASATGTRQLIYTGTPPYPGCPGDVFRRRRTACLGAPGAHDAWHEWSVEGEQVDKIDLEDHAVWYQTNPAMGIRLSEEFAAEECRSMSADGFARERPRLVEPRSDGSRATRRWMPGPGKPVPAMPKSRRAKPLTASSLRRTVPLSACAAR